jgi:hypothetical protein
MNCTRPIQNVTCEMIFTSCESRIESVLLYVYPLKTGNLCAPLNEKTPYEKIRIPAADFIQPAEQKFFEKIMAYFCHIFAR